MGPQSCVSCTQTQHMRGNKKKPLPPFLYLIFSLYNHVLVPPFHLFIPLLSSSITPLVPPSNPSHQENWKSERRKFPNKSLWHREHLSAYCVFLCLGDVSNMSRLCELFRSPAVGTSGPPYLKRIVIRLTKPQHSILMQSTVGRHVNPFLVFCHYHPWGWLSSKWKKYVSLIQCLGNRNEKITGLGSWESVRAPKSCAHVIMKY